MISHIVFFLVFRLSTVILTFANSDSTVRVLVIQQENKYDERKLPQFSVYDGAKTQLQYTIKSQDETPLTSRIMVYPEKEIVGALRSTETNRLFDQAQISILKSDSNEWIEGLVIADRLWFRLSHTIKWNERHLSMTSQIYSLTTKIHDQDNGKLLATFKRRLFNFKPTFDLNIFSNEIPDTLYLFGVVTAVIHERGYT